jgi:hypothetical protein
VKSKLKEIATMSSPVPDLADNWAFTELWIDPTASPPYTLILLTDTAGNSSIYDPAKNYQIIFSGTYQDAKLWLLEDEYERVNGRFQTTDRSQPAAA